ncbi:short chain dehydrogenase reductase family [Colletotrichum plurivorum]|uniref:Short chain dehydrogenase reductase family n=1 Tax=Colletotrichum plurivorum TaxID=2175906 RepID=A0A8H6JB44_9PEZI|nr:short chain dehydrogenase reductase family [Colletotrichum plurivorum]
MASLNISNADIPSLAGKTAIITGGSSGIGYAAAKILAQKGASVHLIDLNPPETDVKGVQFHHCDITNWAELRSVFNAVGSINFAFANAGTSEETDYFADKLEEDGLLAEPTYRVLDVNLRGVLNVVKLALSRMRADKTQGSIVITTSATAYAPEQSLPVYSSGKLALVGLIRALRSTVIRDGITINGVAPAATITKLLPADLAAPIKAQGLPVSSADFVGLALVYSAVAKQSRVVQGYGKDRKEDLWKEGRWNGRIILTLGESYTELEEPIADLSPFWMGRENHRLTHMQQAATDFRPSL